jgi:3-deoxy-manno-octulosonate cytidylyltransferase (CMP-KDO synthetase)
LTEISRSGLDQIAERTLLLIPARLGSTRLDRKALADIGGRPMIAHVMDRAAETGLGKVIVATDDDEIRAAVETHGGEAVMTDPAHRSGSDRIWEALCLRDADESFDYVINLQGDLPDISPAYIRESLRPLLDDRVDIATLAAVIVDPAEVNDPNVVKVVASPLAPQRLHALYFTRAPAPWGDGPHYHHIGLYAYRRAALARFVSLPPSALEMRERLEQLRALEAGMRIEVAVVDSVPIGVDTPADLERARHRLVGA